MPRLITVLTCLIALTFNETKHKTIVLPGDVEHVSMHDVFRSGHQIPFKRQETASKNEFLLFLHHEELAHQLIDVEVHFLLANNIAVALDLLLVSNGPPDTLRELFKLLCEGRMHFVLTHPKDMLESTLRLLVRCVRELQHLPLMFARAACPSCQEVAKLSK